jgi:hypothetical protein
LNFLTLTIDFMSSLVVHVSMWITSYCNWCGLLKDGIFRFIQCTRLSSNQIWRPHILKSSTSSTHSQGSKILCTF